MEYKAYLKNSNINKLLNSNPNLRQKLFSVYSKEPEMLKKKNNNNISKNKNYSKNTIITNNEPRQKLIIRHIKPLVKVSDKNFSNYMNHPHINTIPHINISIEDVSHEYKISDNNSYTNTTNRSIINFKKRLPAIVVSVKRSKKKIRQKNNKNGNIIKIQSAWRGYFLRKIAIGSIKKYIGFIALIKYIQKIYDKNNKKLLMIKLKEYNNKSINPKMYNNENIYINQREKENEFYSSHDLYNIIEKNKKILYIPKKIGKFQKRKNPVNNYTKIKIKRFIKIINKVYYFQYYPILLYRLKILQNLKLYYNILNQMKNIINLINHKRIKKAFNKYRDYNILEKIKEEINKNNQTIKYKLINKNQKDIINKDINYSPIKNLIKKKYEKEKEIKEILINKYFKLWNKNITNQNESHIPYISDYCSTQERRKKKHIKIKYSNDYSFRTENSLRSETKDKIKHSISKIKKMNIKSVVINANKLRNIKCKLAPKMNKLLNLISKINNKKIINKYFTSWKKD